MLIRRAAMIKEFKEFVSRGNVVDFLIIVFPIFIFIKLIA